MTKKKEKKKKATRKTKLVSFSSLPAYREKFEDIKRFLNHDGNLKVILINASNINKIEQEYGKTVYGQVLDSLSNIIASMKGILIRREDIITINHINGDQFFIFLSKYRQEKHFFQSGDLENVADRIQKFINDKIFMTVYSLLKKRPKINVGYAITIYNPLIQEERLIDKLIEDAKTMAQYKEFKAMMRNKEKLQELIIKQEIQTIYQPIVNITNCEIIGYEALSRGPKNTEYENPIVLFNIAEETGLLFELDSLCRKKAFTNAKGIKEGLKLFVNIIPNTIHDPEFKGKYLQAFLDDIKISPRRVVLEVSERQIIDNFNIFKKATQYYSDLGFAIAIDDTGTGYSNLQSLLQIRMQYIKIDISLIRNIDKDPLKQELVRALTQLGNSINARVIAEGIETKSELKTLLKLGIVIGQGFIFAKPAPPFSKVTTIVV
ncbi:MAG: EAL domain-containing protein [Spirochaetes bacterium]|nr:EAL domain-containing protein [Spirochaetota bacterium]